MYFIIETAHHFELAAERLDAAVKRHGFGVLHVHDLGNTLRSKGMPFTEQCKVFEVCNPSQAHKVLAIDMRLNMALPCRISVFTEAGKTRIGLIKPAPMLEQLSDDSDLAKIAQEVQAQMIEMATEAAA